MELRAKIARVRIKGYVNTYLAKENFNNLSLLSHQPLIWLCGGNSLKYTRFEKARIIGARALQISLNAPVLIDVPSNVIDPLEIAMLEFEAGVIPITTRRKGESR